MNEYEYINDTIARETAFDEGYEAGKQAAAEQIFRDLETIASIYQGHDNVRLVLEVAELIGLKKKYGVK